MASRISMLMQVTTNPDNRSDASPHTGGWSESFWAANNLVASDPDILLLCRARANLLPAPASMVGFRLSNYNFVGNKLVPTGSSTSKLQLNGSSSRPTDVPQLSLELAGKSETSANSNRFAVRCIPDAQCKNGEYQPDGGYRGLVTRYTDLIVNHSWKFLGRDLTQPSYNVLSIAGGVVTLSGNPGVVDGTTYVRFRKCVDNAGTPVTGAYLVTAHGDKTVTLAGFPTHALTGPSGTLRIDSVGLFAFGALVPARIVVRKVGRPFESYRGRQSKRR